MTKIKYDINLMRFMTLFETITQSSLKDCIDGDDQLIFIVEENHIGKAVGKNGSNVKRLSSVLKRQIKVVEFNPNVLQFIQNFIYPLVPKEVKNENGIVSIVGPDTKTKGLLIGRDGKNLNMLRDVVKRYFSVEDIKVV